MAKATALVPFSDEGSMPAHLGKAFGPVQNDDLQGGVSGGYGVLSFKGKTWSLNENGNHTYIMKPDDPDEIATSLEVVIIKANPSLSKVYYDGGYTEGSTEKPVCYSNDGVKPATDAASPQCTSCALCQHNAWGSRISENGSKGKACSDSRRLAVVPSGELDRPMLLRVPAATLKELSQFAEMLKRRNAPYQGVVTKISFDPTVAHPKLMFKALRWVSAEEAQQIADTMRLEVISQITGTASSSAARELAPIADLRPEPAKPKPAKAKAEAVEDAEEVEAAPAEEAPKPKKGKALAAAKTAPKEEAPKSKLASKINEASSELDDALASLDDL